MTATGAPQGPSVEETLGWEAEQRPRAATAAVLSGLLLIVSNVLSQFALRDGPTANLLDSLQRAASANPVSLKARQVLFFDDNAVPLVIGGLLNALCLVGIALALGYLFRATVARRPELSPVLRVAVVAGPITAAVGTAMASIARTISVGDFASGSDRSSEAARDALQAPAVIAGEVLYAIGLFGLAVGLFFLALNAMRVGLLTRFLGVLGMITGAVWILGFDQIGLVRGLWFVFLGLLIAGRTPGGVPAAWHTGRAVPWPSQQQIREQRAAARGETPAPAAAEADRTPTAVATPHPQSAKRKRKKRR